MIMLSEIEKAVGGHMQGADVLCESVGSDSRRIVKNQLFVGIKGEHFDGSVYAKEAIKQGAAAALVADANTQASPAVIVSDARLALGQLAKYWRNKFKVSLVAVTGSNGKTTVKEMIAAILTVSNNNVLATKGNLNNDIGMPMTLLKMRKENTYAVIEMGMSHEGEIRYLTNIAQPAVAVVNNAGTAHIGEVGSREAIARAKGEIFEGLNDDGIAIINADDDFAEYWKSLNSKRKVITFGLKKEADVSATYQVNDNFSVILSSVQLTTPNGQTKFDLHVLGVHNIYNALAASAAAVALGISNEEIAKGLAGFGAVKGRLNWLAGFNGSVVIDDTYNANPDSMKAALDVLANQQAVKVFVMGDMGELGLDAGKMHAEIGAYARQKNINQLFTFGELSVQAAAAFGENAVHFSSLEATNLEALIANLKPLMHKGVTLLVKGSRFMQMERVVAQIIETNNQLETKPCC